MEDNNKSAEKSGKDYYRERFPELYNTPGNVKSKPKAERIDNTVRGRENNDRNIKADSKIPAKKMDLSGDIARQYKALHTKYNFNNMKNKDLKKKYAKIILIYLLIMYVLFLLLNGLIIPAIVHSRPLVTVPNIMGLKEINAKEKLENIDLEWEVVSEQYNEDTKPGYVLKQDPQPGVEVKSGRPVYLTVSKGREAVEVPNVRGLSIRNVEIKLMNYGLKIGRIDSMYSDEFGKNIVVKQYPNPGEECSEKGSVNITVSIGSSSKVMVPKVVGFALDGIYTFIEENGLKLGNVIYEKNETYQSNVIMYQYPAAGDSVQRGTSINITVAQ
ncbi:MAG: PASTA domain-containing protein [bacterium]